MTLPHPPRDYDPLDDGVAPGRDGIPRDRWDRPLLVPIGGGPRQPYTAMSTLAAALQDEYGLNIWDRRMIARGIGLSQELAALCAAETYHTGFGERDVGKNKESGRRLDEYVERGRDVARAHQKRDYGTAFHGFTEPENKDYVIVPDYMQDDVESFWKALKDENIEIVATEIFVVNETLKAAGTFDHFVRIPGVEGLVCLDKKTGVYHPEACRIQMAGYAGGEVYDKETDARYSFASFFGEPVNQDFAITAHTRGGSGITILYEEPLEVGRRAALAAKWVREYRKENGTTKGGKVFEART